MTLLLCALVGFFVSQLVKTMALRTQYHPGPSSKMVLALVGSLAVAAAYFPHRVEYLLIYGGGGAGLAVLMHKGYRTISAGGDWLIQEIIQKRGRR